MVSAPPPPPFPHGLPPPPHPMLNGPPPLAQLLPILYITQMLCTTTIDIKYSRHIVDRGCGHSITIDCVPHGKSGGTTIL
jgi:hypothetical protein